MSFNHKDILRADTKYFPHLQLITTTAILFMLIYSPGLEWWLLSFFVYFLTGCLGVAVTFHRQLTHQSFQFRWKWMEYLFTFLGSVGGTGSSIGWVAIHKEHHTYGDKDGDPHRPENGFWNVVIPNYKFDMNTWAVRRLITDKFHSYMHNYYFLVVGMWMLFLFVVGGLHFLLFAGIIPMGIQLWANSLSNYINHTWGYRNYETNDNSRNTWWFAPFTWGESWHNNHHAKPGNWSVQHNWWEIDPAGMVIRLIKK